LITSVLQLCNLSLIQLVFCVHSHKETFTILHHSFTNFSHSSIIFFISSSLNTIIIQDFYFFFCSTLSICSSIISYMFLIMTLCFHNKHHCSAHIRQFISKSSCVDRSVFTDDSEPDVTFLIENLKNVIMKKLSVSCMTESSVFSLTSSAASFSAASLSVSFSATSQSSTLASVSGSPAPAISVSAIPGFTASAFITSSPHFKKMLCRLNESHLSACTLSLFLLTLRIIYYICVFRNRNVNVVLFYTCECEAFTLVSEAILIKDDNTAETTLFCSQASFITFSPSSAGKVVHTL
ncbi:hypothetical protein BDDG_13147, partial [Blastomyces dermatitidis ATCC 18188]